MGKHIDKYGNLRRAAGDRGHYRSDGLPKRALSQEVAEGTVTWLEQKGDIAFAYECPVCRLWHVGKRERYRVDP